MKKQQHYFNFLLRKYNAYIRRRKNLIASNRNQRRQLILEKHIERLFYKLKNLKFSIQKATALASISVAAITFSVNDAKAQNFAPDQTNPFGLTTLPTGYGYSNVTMADLDGDGDFDLLSGEYYGNFVYYENTGTNIAPAFGTAQINPLGLVGTSDYYSGPNFVDIDNDGDFDVMAHGYQYGSFLFYENTGTNLAPAFSAPQTNPFSLTSMGFRTLASPTFADLDNDGDLDLLSCIDYTSSFLYYENTGTVSAPVFAAAVLNPFGIAQATGNDWTNPCFVDIDNDGDFDIILGDASGNFGFLKNIGDANTPVFDTEITNPFNLSNLGTYNNACFVDLDNDGDLDLMGGDQNGNISYFEMINLPPDAPTDVTPATNLSICNNTSTTLTATGVGTIGWYDAANGGNYLGGGNTYTTPSLTTNVTYFAQDSTAGGASSNRTAITVNVAAAIDVTTSVNGLTISANETGATYQWLDCNNSNAVISSETNQDYTASANGNYAVEITIGGCADTSACVSISTVGINENDLTDKIKIYPNPTNTNFVIETAPSIKNANVKVYGVDGKLVLVTKTISDRLNVDVSLWEKGIYILSVESGSAITNSKLIVE